MTYGRRVGVLLCGHGSRDDDTRTEFERFVDASRSGLADIGLSVTVEGAYLEFLHPSIEESFRRLVHIGSDFIIAQPLMLFAARHAISDIPSQINQLAKLNPTIAIACGQELSLDDALLAAAVDRIESVLGDDRSSADKSETLLLVIGRGSSDAAANSLLANLSDRLKQRLGIDRADWAFAGIVPPSIEEALRLAAGQGFRRVVVFPYFLFDGTLVKRIRRTVADTAGAFPNVAFSLAPHLGEHPAVVGTVVTRIARMISAHS